MSDNRVEIIEPGLAVEYDADKLDIIRTISFDAEELKEKLIRQQKNIEFYVDCADDYLAVEYDWSTGIDFGDHEGGGDFIVLVPDAGWNEYDSVLSVSYEWNDDALKELGIVHENDSHIVMGILVDALVEFVEGLR